MKNIVIVLVGLLAFSVASAQTDTVRTLQRKTVKDKTTIEQKTRTADTASNKTIRSSKIRTNPDGTKAKSTYEKRQPGATTRTKTIVKPGDTIKSTTKSTSRDKYNPNGTASPNGGTTTIPPKS